MFKKLNYSLGAFATSLAYQIFAAYIIFYYVDVMRLPVYMAGSAMFIYGLWNALNDPLAGFLSDSTHSRFGRRIPYILLGAIPLGLAFYFLWRAPFFGLDEPYFLFLYFVTLICLFDAFYTIVVLNWSSLFPEMFSGLKERSLVNIFRQGFALLGFLFGIAIPPQIFTKFGWENMGLFFGLMITLLWLITLFGCREKKEFSREPSLPLFQALKVTLADRSFMLYVAADLMISFGFITLLASIPFYVKYVLERSPQEVTLLFALAFFIAFPMLFVWRMIIVRQGAKVAMMAAVAAMALSLSPLLFSRASNIVMLAAALFGASLAGYLMVSDVVLSDIIDEDEVATGRRREGMFFGIRSFVSRFAIVIQSLTISSIFLLCGYNPYVFTQPKAFYAGISALVIVIPMIAFGLAFAIINLYPLAGNKIKEVRRKLDEIHLMKGVK
ncbi:MAG: MFS transporter [Candidatus Margulisbacteria bacterium]|nr:MFS transporter [Candidatus Margulisiibacteriota bacterium]MBU1617720.1 MFS transporter [Candidatus Margulisiibacteriota bacterium]